VSREEKVVPVTLPKTGGEDRLPWMALLVGLAMLAASSVLRRRAGALGG
jgi:LPXTG-motif cell wall-anchored protein